MEARITATSKQKFEGSMGHKPSVRDTVGSLHSQLFEKPNNSDVFLNLLTFENKSIAVTCKK